MGRPAKVMEEQKLEMQVLSGPQIRHIIRGISNYTSEIEGIFTREDVEMHIASMVGWKLRSVHFIGVEKSAQTANKVYEFAYILEAEGR